MTSGRAYPDLTSLYMGNSIPDFTSSFFIQDLHFLIRNFHADEHAAWYGRTIDVGGIAVPAFVEVSLIYIADVLDTRIELYLDIVVQREVVCQPHVEGEISGRIYRNRTAYA